MHNQIAAQALFHGSTIRKKACTDTVSNISETQIQTGWLNLKRCQSVIRTDVSGINQAINLVIGENTVWKTHYCVQPVCIKANSTFTLTKAKASPYARRLMFEKV